MVLRQSFLAALGCCVATAAHAQKADFTCPRSGVVEERAVSTFKYSGVSATDPYVCIRVNPSGKPEERLFNYYSLSDNFNTAAANAGVRAGMLDLLSGSKTSVSFAYTASNSYVIQETWTFLRREPYTLNGKTFETVVLGHDTISDPRGRAAFRGHYVSWLEPKSGLWLKMDLTVLSGETRGFAAAYQDLSITGP